MRLEITLPARAEAVATARQAFGAWARSLTLTDSELEDVKMCLSEATTNAVLHGSPRPHALFHVLAHVTGPELVVIVMDSGRGFEVSLPIATPCLCSERGRGLFLMQQLADRLDIASTAGGTTIRLTKRLWRHCVGEQ
jgi:serine/threonine-protein kinase RsbW